MIRFTCRGECERRVLATFFVAGLLAGGCDISHALGSLDASGSGGQADNGSMGGQAGRQGPAPIDAGYPGDVASLGAVESWTGYLENFQLPSGSDALKLSFAFDPSGVVVGSVKFGTAAPPPPPTDPNVGYPPGFNTLASPDTYPTEGFAYSMARGSLDGTRLRFTIWMTELWSVWCALQTPAPESNYTSCVPNWGYSTSADGSSCAQINPSTSQSVSIDCGKLALCYVRQICSCSASGCGTQLNRDSIQFDVALSVAGANGSITGQIGDHNVRLTQDP